MSSNNQNFNYDLVVIGAGPGGYVAAIKAAQEGLKTAIVEANHLGGICLNWGCIPTKALLRSAEIYQNIKHANDFGITVENVAIDLAAIVKRSRSISNKLSLGIGHLLKKHKVDVISGFATITGTNEIAIAVKDKESITVNSKHIIVATGAKARNLQGFEPDGDRVWSYKEALVPTQLPSSLLVIGSGAIGLEFANFYHAIGSKVTVVEMADQILPQEDVEIANFAQQVMNKRGMEFSLSSQITKLERFDNHVVAHLSNAQGEVAKEFSHVICATGVVPNSKNIGLETVGVTLTEQGFIETSEGGQTNIPSIYAIGDVAGSPCLAHKASHQAIQSIEHIIAQGSVHLIDNNMIPSCTYCFPQIASIGLTEAKARALGKDIKVGKFPFNANGKALALGEDNGMMKVIFDSKTGELLGAHLVGAEVTELISSFTVAKTLETTEEELMHTIFPHPTLSEMIHEAVLSAYQKAIHI